MDGETVFSLVLDRHAPELFVVRARAVAPGLDLDPDDPRVVDVCRRLDGLPLGVELAAAQLHFLGLDELLDRLDGLLDLGHRGRQRGGPRHTSLDRTIAWSYDLLDEPSQRLLRHLGVFPATFDLRAAEVVGRDPSASALTTVSDLVAKHLLVREVESGRFRLLETIRTFALRRLVEHDEQDEALERLRRHVVTDVTARSRLDRWFSGSDAATFRSELDNARVAFDLSMDAGRIGDAVEILVAGAFLWRNTLSCSDGRRWIARIEERADELDPRDEAWLALARTDLGQGTADHGAMHRAATSAVELARAAGDREALVVAMHFEALPYAVAAPEEAGRRLDEAMAIAEELDDPCLVHLLEVFSAVATLSGGDLDTGLARAERVGNAVSGDGYEVFLANWASWTASLIREDAERLRHWTDRQRHYLSQVGLPETWLTMWSMALSSAMEREDIHDRLLQARHRADREGLQSATDTVLALAMIAHYEDRSTDAGELLGVITGKPLNNTAHYVLYRTLRRMLEEELGTATVRGLLADGSTRSPEDVLEAHDLALSSSR